MLLFHHQPTACMLRLIHLLPSLIYASSPFNASKPPTFIYVVIYGDGLEIYMEEDNLRRCSMENSLPAPTPRRRTILAWMRCTYKLKTECDQTVTDRRSRRSALPIPSIALGRVFRSPTISVYPLSPSNPVNPVIQ
ncbi:hypothetical protein C8F01DRAFT_1197123 [Mycena amicta]|nr:hypothetical protein C8F01DRAFT_1197123 [Mycena amicta]